MYVFGKKRKINFLPPKQLIFFTWTVSRIFEPLLTVQSGQMMPFLNACDGALCTFLKKIKFFFSPQIHSLDLEKNSNRRIPYSLSDFWSTSNCPILTNDGFSECLRWGPLYVFEKNPKFYPPPQKKSFFPSNWTSKNSNQQITYSFPDFWTTSNCPIWTNYGFSERLRWGSLHAFKKD